MSRDLPSPEILRQIFKHETARGRLRWKHRDDLGDHSAAWNARFAGKLCGYVRPNGYRVVRICGVLVFEHQAIWAYVHGEWPSMWIDHRNGKPADNRLDNLRLATGQQNSANRKANRNSKSGVKGVYWDNGSGKWRAQIKFSGKARYLGIFDKIEDAKAAHDAAAKELFGDFCRF